MVVRPGRGTTTADGFGPPSVKGGGEMVTYDELFAFATLIVAIITLVLVAERGK